jgi:hypothetical protein
MPDKNGIPTEQEIYDALMPKKVIRKGDMSPETKALPNEVVKPPKGIGKSENDMEPFPHRTGLKMLSNEEYEKLPKMKDLPERAIEFPNVKKDEKGRVIYKKKGGAIKAKKMSSGGSVSSASKRADGIAVKGKTRGKIC